MNVWIYSKNAKNFQTDSKDGVAVDVENSKAVNPETSMRGPVSGYSSGHDNNNDNDNNNNNNDDDDDDKDSNNINSKQVGENDRVNNNRSSQLMVQRRKKRFGKYIF